MSWVNKECLSCNDQTLCQRDPHSECYECLGPHHDTARCSHCNTYPPELLSVRIVIMNECLDHGDWAEDAPVRLRLAEQEAWFSQNEIENPLLISQ
jgi:hypothetical protein